MTVLTIIKLTDGTLVTTDGSIEVQSYPGADPQARPLVLIVRDTESTGIYPWDKVVFINQSRRADP